MSKEGISQEEFDAQQRAIQLDRQSWTYRRMTIFLLLFFFIAMIVYVAGVLPNPSTTQDKAMEMSFNGINWLAGFWIFGSMIKDPKGFMKNTLSHGKD